MKCELCKQEMVAGDELCPSCGKLMNSVIDPILICPQCGTPIISGNAFCNGCGQDLSEPELFISSTSDKKIQMAKIIHPLPESSIIIIALLSFLLVVSLALLVKT